MPVTLSTFKDKLELTSDEFAFKFNAVCVAVETGLLASLVLSALPNPTIDFVIPPTVPVKVGEARFALSASAVLVAKPDKS